MEHHELTAWSDSIACVIDLPKREYRKMVDCVFAPFSAALAETGVYQRLCLELNDLHKQLHKKVEL